MKAPTWISPYVRQATAVFGLVALTFSSHSSASNMNDWQCLTSDMTGNEEMRQEFIRASAEAAQVFGIAPAILVGIKRVESGRGLNPMVTNRNNDGTVDRGFYQVNADFWLPVLRRTGANIGIGELHGVRQNALIAAWVLRRQMNRSDVPTYLDAVGYYHKGGGRDARAHRIRKIYTDKFMVELRRMYARCG